MYYSMVLADNCELLVSGGNWLEARGLLEAYSELLPCVKSHYDIVLERKNGDGVFGDSDFFASEEDGRAACDVSSMVEILMSSKT